MFELVNQNKDLCVSVMYDSSIEALEDAVNLLKNADKTDALGFVSVTECEMRDGEIYEVAVLLARSYQHA